LKALWAKGDFKEVARREIAFLAAYAGRSRPSANYEILGYGGLPFSTEEYDAIQSMKKSDMGKKEETSTN